MRRCLVGGGLLLTMLFGAVSSGASKVSAPPEAREGLRRLYSGDPEAGIDEFRRLQARDSRNPLGYLLEANARWWVFYCEACEIRWNTIDAWQRSRRPEDDRYFALCDRSISLAEAALAKHDSALMHFYAGMAFGLRARLHGLRMEARAAATAGVEGYRHLLRAVELDRGLGDAFTGLGLYSYYAATLGVVSDMLRWVLAMPPGDKALGVRQLRWAIRTGELTSTEAAVYLARNLRNYDQEYTRALELMQAVVARYPSNGVFLLLLGDLHAKIGHKEEAADRFRAAIQAARPNTACGARVRELARISLQALEARGAKRDGAGR